MLGNYRKNKERQALTSITHTKDMESIDKIAIEDCNKNSKTKKKYNISTSPQFQKNKSKKRTRKRKRYEAFGFNDDFNETNIKHRKLGKNDDLEEEKKEIDFYASLCVARKHIQKEKAEKNNNNDDELLILLQRIVQTQRTVINNRRMMLEVMTKTLANNISNLSKVVDQLS